MKKLALFVVFLVAVAGAHAQPTRVVVLEFDDDTGMQSDTRLGGMVNAEDLAKKGVYVLAKQLLGKGDFVVIDRREFLKQMDDLRLRDGANVSTEPGEIRDAARSTPVRPSFLQAAQALRADVVLRGALVSFSTGKEMINQAGYSADFSTVSVRMMLEALDVVDGAVIAIGEGVARRKFRQTPQKQTLLGEDEILTLFGEAIAAAVPEVETALASRVEEQRARPKVQLAVKTSADPAMVEIDGILVGTTPMEGLEVYKGDHVLTVGKPGYQDVTKRILLEQDTSITVPMISVQLDADQLKDVLEKMRMHVLVGEPALIVETTETVVE